MLNMISIVLKAVFYIMHIIIISIIVLMILNVHFIVQFHKYSMIHSLLRSLYETISVSCIY